MNNDLNPLLIEMFDSDIDVKATPLVELPSMDDVISQIDSRAHSWAGDETVRRLIHVDLLRTVFGIEAQEPAAATVQVTDEFTKSFLGVDLPTPTPIGPKPGHIPTTPTPIRPVKVPKHRAALERILKPIMAKAAPMMDFTCDAWNNFLDGAGDFVDQQIVNSRDFGYYAGVSGVKG